MPTHSRQGDGADAKRLAGGPWFHVCAEDFFGGRRNTASQGPEEGDIFNIDPVVVIKKQSPAAGCFFATTVGLPSYMKL